MTESSGLDRNNPTESDPSLSPTTSVSEALPTIFTPEDVAKHLGWSQRKVREKARQIGACHVLGNRMIMTAADIEKLLEATKPAPAPRKEVPVAIQRAVLFGAGRGPTGKPRRRKD
jgi:hypothetical protein